MLVFVQGGESPSRQGYNQQQTQPTYDIRQKLNPGYIGGRRALSTLLQPCSFAYLSTRATNYVSMIRRLVSRNSIYEAEEFLAGTEQNHKDFQELNIIFLRLVKEKKRLCNAKKSEWKA